MWQIPIRSKGVPPRRRQWFGKGCAETTDHLAVEVEVEIKDVSRVGIQNEGKIYIVCLTGGNHPADAAFETIPVRLAIAERKQGGNTKPGFALVIDERLLRRMCPDGLAPGRVGLEFCCLGDHAGRLRDTMESGEKKSDCIRTKPMSFLSCQRSCSLSSWK